ncbi:MAG: hypothetical protein C4532_11300 [Candidatus Abyssobacteria bacterium SURF_17]|uniref:Uncharacterized protein n=1 Tax=Candidatus Abyssobacteria bacterium SURF_17 TaxID=2093361 RepID=A0A419EWS2_9BACT|nr:MAG: hypothetical protein C4532_11300 [Candidatus Abyssubacteria bacterium SURF_17]
MTQCVRIERIDHFSTGFCVAHTGAGEEKEAEMKASNILRKACYGGIGAVEFSRERLSSIRKAVRDSLDEFVKRGERLDRTEDSLAKALLAALSIKSKIPTANDVNSIIPGYDDLTVTEIIDQIKRLTMKELETVREYEYHNFNRIRVLRQIDRELDEIRIIPDYDTLSVAGVLEKLDELNRQELAAVKDYEKSHRNRTTVLKAIENRLAKAA